VILLSEMIGSIDWTQRLHAEAPTPSASDDSENTPVWSRGLKTIDLSYNDITAKGALALLSALQKNKNIVDINLAGNDVATVLALFHSILIFLMKKPSNSGSF